MNELKAGRELDALVAEKVMGEAYPSGPPPDVWPRGRISAGDHWQWSEKAGDWIAKPFSTDIAAAWEVVEKMVAKGFTVTLMLDGPKARPHCEMALPQWSGSEVWDGDTPAHAICLAALAALSESPSVVPVESSSFGEPK